MAIATRLNELGAASKLWLYIWIRCEEQRAAIEEDVSAFIRATGISRSSYSDYRKILEDKGYLKVDEDGRLSVTVKSEKT